MKEGKGHRKAYAGEWVEDSKEGSGICYYKGGGRYEGEWKWGKYEQATTITITSAITGTSTSRNTSTTTAPPPHNNKQQ